MFRYKIDIIKALKDKGYNATRILRENTLPQATMQKVRTGNTNISLRTVNKICFLLDCQPDDILEYTKDD